MPTPGWLHSHRREQLPPPWIWQRIRKAVAARAGGRCEWPGWNVGRTQRNAGPTCWEPGTDTDHIGDRDNHELSNLQWLCHAHHQRKTILDRGTRLRSDRRPRERHPGLRGDGNHARTCTQAQRPQGA